jgi:RNA polymerase sigma-70 factor (ECF subfamily)
MGAPIPRARADSLKPPGETGAPTLPDDASLHLRDLELVRRVLGGNAEAVDDFVLRMSCARRFLAFRNASLGAPLGPDELEDCVQSALLAVWRKLGQFAGRASLEAWVYRFTQLELANRLRGLERRPRALESAPEPSAEANARVDAAEAERLYRALARLDEDSADVIRLKHLEACTFEEIGARLAVPTNTAKTRYYRGMERLRRILRDPRGPGGPA